MKLLKFIQKDPDFWFCLKLLALAELPIVTAMTYLTIQGLVR